MPPVKIVGFEDHVRKIWSWIMRENVGLLAVTGDAGVGKTTLLRLIQDKLSNMYNIVLWVTVSEDVQFGQLRDEIWRRLGSFDEKWVEKSAEEKSECIYDVLSRNKFVLFLDDIWDAIDLASLGVPHPGTQNESIVIVSSRSSRACLKMEVQKIYELEVLTVKPAWALFQMKVGEDVLFGDANILNLAKKIFAYCRGSPILLCTVAGALRYKKTYKEWQFALEVLEETGEAHGLHPRLLLRFCYDSLPSEVVKFCFLYFSLFPEDFKILKSDLADFWISEEFFGYYNSQGNALKFGCDIIDILVRANLFEEENDYLKMLDSIRDFALAVLLESTMFNNAQLIAVPKFCGFLPFVDFVSNKKLGAGRISSLGSIIQKVRNITPDLLAFFHKHNPFIMFKNKYMPELTVLDLSNSPIEEVPRGISELVSLQHLNLSHTYIERLPVELKKLKKLKCLNLENDDQLRIIPRQVISSLPLLQVLRMFHCGYSLVAEEDNILCAMCMDISEMRCLRSLKILSITITCASALKDFFSIHTLPSCAHALSLEVFWGSKSLDISSVAAMQHLHTFEIHHAELLSDINVKFFMGSSFASLREVKVEKCSNLKHLSWLILAPNLVILRVSSCPEMEEIISVEQLGKIQDPDMNPFTKLEVLELESLGKLKSIYWKALPFQFIKKIQVLDCPMLKKLPMNAKRAKTITSSVEDVEIIVEEDWWKQIEWKGSSSALKAGSSPQSGCSCVIRSQSDGRRGSNQRFKRYFCSCLSGMSDG